MAGIPVSPRRIFGVDFSAAEKAGRHIWVCRAHPGADGLRVESVDPLSALPGGARDRRAALRSLVQKVLAAARSAWGFDFPFGLPQALVPALPLESTSGWARHLEAVASMGSPERLREACRQVRGGKAGKEHRRRTDIESSTPFSPTNLRMYKQTFYGMTEVLRPLHGSPGVAVLPMDPLPSAGAGSGRPGLGFHDRAAASAPHIYVLEACPASLLRARGYFPRLRHYKGRSADHSRCRREILDRLVAESLVRPIKGVFRRRIVEDWRGDGLDSVLAAVAAWLGAREEDHEALRLRYGNEGYVYYGSGR